MSVKNDVYFVADESGKYDAEYERQMQHMRTTLHSQAVSAVIFINIINIIYFNTTVLLFSLNVITIFLPGNHPPLVFVCFFCIIELLNMLQL